MNKFERQGTILRLVGERQLSTQSDVVEALRDEGLDAVQATVSRDIAQLGLVKVRGDDGRLVYALPGAADLDRLSELAAALRRWVVALEATGNLVVVRTPPGFANALAQAFDEALLPEIAGCIAGDDTIFLAAREGMTGGGARRAAAASPGRATRDRHAAAGARESISAAARSRASATGPPPSSRPCSTSPTS